MSSQCITRSRILFSTHKRPSKIYQRARVYPNVSLRSITPPLLCRSALESRPSKPRYLKPFLNEDWNRIASRHKILESCSLHALTSTVVYKFATLIRNVHRVSTTQPPASHSLITNPSTLVFRCETRCRSPAMADSMIASFQGVCALQLTGIVLQSSILPHYGENTVNRALGGLPGFILERCLDVYMPVSKATVMQTRDPLLPRMGTRMVP